MSLLLLIIKINILVVAISYVWLISVGEFLLNDQFRAVKTVVKESDNGKMKYITEEKNLKLYST